MCDPCLRNVLIVLAKSNAKKRWKVVVKNDLERNNPHQDDGWGQNDSTVSTIYRTPNSTYQPMTPLLKQGNGSVFAGYRTLKTGHKLLDRATMHARLTTILAAPRCVSSPVCSHSELSL